MNAKVFILISCLNETGFLLQRESCECKSELNESVYNSNQKWNHNEWRCECKELDDLSSCKDDYAWNPSTHDCKCNEECKTERNWY